MQSERPKWCIEVNCPYYANRCILRQKTYEGVLSSGRRKDFNAAQEKLAADSPAQIIDKCASCQGTSIYDK